MIDVSYYKFFIKIRNVWFPTDQISKTKKSNITIIHTLNNNDELQLSTYSFIQNTLLTDLSLNEEQLYSLLNNHYRNEIRKADNYDFKINIYDSADILSNQSIINNFKKAYNAFRKKIKLKVKFNSNLIYEYLNKNNIVITTITFENTIICQHLYIKDDKNVRLLYSVSSFRSVHIESKIIGYANKKLHWIDILHFKNRNIKIYDWGGISSIEEPNTIDKFKIRFGGTAKKNYVSYISNSVLGKIILKMKFKRVKENVHY